MQTFTNECHVQWFGFHLQNYFFLKKDANDWKAAIADELFDDRNETDEKKAFGIDPIY